MDSKSNQDLTEEDFIPFSTINQPSSSAVEFGNTIQAAAGDAEDSSNKAGIQLSSPLPSIGGRRMPKIVMQKVEPRKWKSKKKGRVSGNLPNPATGTPSNSDFIGFDSESSCSYSQPQLPQRSKPCNRIKNQDKDNPRGIWDYYDQRIVENPWRFLESRIQQMGSSSSSSFDPTENNK